LAHILKKKIFEAHMIPPQRSIHLTGQLQHSFPKQESYEKRITMKIRIYRD